MIGSPQEYEKRAEAGDFKNKKEEFEKLDLTVPIKVIVLQPMDNDSDCDADQKMNQKDQKLIENPEEANSNPFKL